MKSRSQGCALCWEYKNKKGEFEGQPHKILFETQYFWVKFSLFPVTPNHLLIIPKRHFCKATDMNLDELLDFYICRKKIENWYQSQGINAWNSGDNYGKAAGQSREHFHYHYFDRKEGDIADPRGGIRNFMPPIETLGAYKDET